MVNIGGHRKLFCRKAMLRFGSHESPLYRGSRQNRLNGILIGHVKVPKRNVLSRSFRSRWQGTGCKVMSPGRLVRRAKNFFQQGIMRVAPAVRILCVAAALILIPLASPTSSVPPLSRQGAFHFCHTCLASPPPRAGNDRSSLSHLDLRLRGGSGTPGEATADHDVDTSEEEMAEVDASPTEGDVPDNAPASCPGTASDQAGKTDGCAGCPNQKACSSGEKAVDPDAEAIAERMAEIKYKVLADI